MSRYQSSSDAPRTVRQTNRRVGFLCKTAAMAALALLPLTSRCSDDSVISLKPTLTDGALHTLNSGPVDIRGTASAPVMVRVTSSNGAQWLAKVTPENGSFLVRFPDDFGATAMDAPCSLFIDAAPAGSVHAGVFPVNSSSEATLLVYSKNGMDLASAFTDNFRDRMGNTDKACKQWPILRTLTNLYMHSRGAALAKSGNPGFDLNVPADFTWFKNNLSLYDFNNRDRDWTNPLRHRVARTFWQGVWPTWFNSSNDNPLDGNPKNENHSNYLPYTFSNDFADLLIMYLSKRNGIVPMNDDVSTICSEGARNLMAMQHRDESNFALKDSLGKQETYTAGAFHYGMFTTGAYMTEGVGWFTNPAFRDYESGGVLNGRVIWALGETLRRYPNSPDVPQLKQAIALGLKFCLHDGATGGYVKRTAAGHTYWRDAGEHAYLLLGMLGAAAAAPQWKIALDPAKQPAPLTSLCADSLDALVDLEQPSHQWSQYPNVDAMAIAALAEGAALFADSPRANAWKLAAMRAADAWMQAKIDASERREPCVHFGLRVSPDKITNIWSAGGKTQLFYYQTGHWIHALADLYALTGEPRYRRRAEAMTAYLCGDNPFRARLFNEMGGVYNWSDDTDGDGIEDTLKQDMYPESTAFCQIGISHLINAINLRSPHK